MSMINGDTRLDRGIIESASVDISDALTGQSANSLVLPYLYPENLLQPDSSELPESSEMSLQGQTLSVQMSASQRVNGQETEHPPENPSWWLVYTKSRQEKKLAEQLAAQHVPHFLPVVKRKSLSRGKTRTAQIPLFSGYLFFCGIDQQRITALQTNRIVAMTQVVDGEQLRDNLRQIAELIALDAPLTPESRLVQGQRVRVKSGLFKGYEGIVMKRRGKTRLFVAVEYMEMGASMEIQNYLLEPI
ncbi:MAG: transcription termination/antitermination NusG family protein [Pirellulales bacterium]